MKVEMSPDTREMLQSLQQAVNDALEKKRRLGQYAVVWRDNQPQIIGEENPVNKETTI